MTAYLRTGLVALLVVACEKADQAAEPPPPRPPGPTPTLTTPDSRTAELRENRPPLIQLSSDVSVNGRVVGKLAAPDLQSVIARALPPPSISRQLIIMADPDIQYAHVVTAMNAAKQAGYTDIMFSATP